MSPKLTIGCATYDDQKGLAFTLTILREEIVRLGLQDQVQLLCVDNHPGGKEAAEVKNTCRKVRARYIPLAEPVGTAPPRNLVFQEAAGEWVICVDSHVWFVPGTLTRILQFIDNNTSRDLFQAVLLNSSIYNDDGTPAIQWTHWLPRMGEDGLFGKQAINPAAADPELLPFEIPGGGCWFLLSRKEAWLGWHPEMRGFGVEGYLHAKYYQQGRRVWCLPFVRGWHWFRDSKSQPVSYDMSWEQRTRNYLLSYRETGVPGFSELKQSHVRTGRTSTATWSKLCKELGIEEAAAIAAEHPRAQTVKLPGIKPEEQQTLQSLPCPQRGRRSGSVLCNQGCPSQQSSLWSTFDCRRYGLVTLSAVRKDLRSCFACQAQKEHE